MAAGTEHTAGVCGGPRDRIIAGVRRYLPALTLNVLVPGTGLMLLGRAWLGLSLAMWYGLAAEAFLGAWLIAPAVVPGWLLPVAAALAGLAWLAGQVLLIRRIAFLRDPKLAEEMALIRKTVEDALAAGDHRAARTALRVALSVDDADIASRVLYARLMTATCGGRRARQAWQGAARLDTERAFAGEIEAALHKLETA